MAKIYKIIFSLFLFIFLPSLVSAATLSISPKSGTFEVGDKVMIKVLVGSSEAINAISGTVSFPSSIFTIESVSKSGSMLNFWVTDPSFSQAVGIFQFEGVALSGFQSGSGTVITATLRATKPGSGRLSFVSGQILANDGQGTNVTGDLNGVEFSVVPKKEVEKVASEEKVVEQSISKLPEITLVKKFGEWAILGTSDYFHNQVLLTFITEDEVKVLIDGTTDEKGKFIILVPKILKHGVYKVFATITQDSGQRHNSNEITISFGNIFFDLSFGMQITIIIMALIILLLALLICLCAHKNKKHKHD
jgi:hypothetical protein